MKLSIENCPIKENSFLARIAAYRLRSSRVAMVWGKQILLFGVSKNEFLASSKWVKHEMEHVRQFAYYGFFKFLFLYLIESIKNGYQNNKFEIAARRAETIASSGENDSSRD